MIIINAQIGDKRDIIADHRTFPHLFIWNDELKEYEKTSNFYWEFDNDFNLIVETLLDWEQLRTELLKVLNKQKEFAEEIIKREQQKLVAINKVLGVSNGQKS